MQPFLLNIVSMGIMDVIMSTCDKNYKCKMCGGELPHYKNNLCISCKEKMMKEKHLCACGCGKMILRWNFDHDGLLRERRFEESHGGHKIKYVKYDNVVEYVSHNTCPVCHRKFYDARTLRVHIDENRCLDTDGMEKFKAGWNRTCHCGCGRKVPPGRLGFSGHTKDEPWNKGMTKEDDERLLKSLERRLAKMEDEKRGVAGKSITSIEFIIKDLLDGMKIEYVHQYNFNNLFLSDFAIPSKKLLIECDGDYWHHFPKGLLKDKIRKRQAEQAGWRMLRLWERDIRNNPIECKVKIRELCKVA